jgi:GAF domain-containing protein
VFASLRKQLDRGDDVRTMFRVAIETVVSGLSWTRGIAVVYSASDSEDTSPSLEIVGTFDGEMAPLLATAKRVARQSEPYGDAGGIFIPVVPRDRRVGVLYVEGPPHPGSLAFTAVVLVAEILAEAIERRQIVDKGGEVDDFTIQELEQSVLLDSILDEIVDDLRLEFAAISLVDPDQQRISMVRTRNIAPGWRRTVDYPLSKRGVQTFVVETGKTFKSKDGEYNALFDLDTWNKYVHKDLARIWCPILDGNRAIGTIEAGCHIDRAAGLLTPEVCARVEQLGATRGTDIGRYAPRSRRFKVLAEETAAAAGATGSLLLKYLPQNTADLMVIQTGRVSAELPSLVRKLATAPGATDILELCAGGPVARVHDIPVEGARCCFAVEFRDRATMQAGNNRQANAFVRRMTVAVRAAHLREHLTAVKDDSERLAGLHDLIGQTAVGSPIERALEEIAQRAISVLDADAISLYQHSRNRREPWRPLLQHYGVLRTQQMISDSFPRRIFEGLGQQQSLFVTDVPNNRLLGQARPGDRISRFAVREGIESTAIVAMPGPEELEVSGLLFINYRSRRDFPPRERREIEAIANSIAKIIQVHRYRDLIQERVLRREAELDALRQLDTILVTNLEIVDLTALCNGLLGVIVSIIQATVGCLLWEEVPGGDLEFRASHGFPEGYKARWRRDNGLIGDVMRSGKSKIVPRTWEEPRYLPSIRQMPSELIVPIKDGERVVGVINLEHDEPEKFSQEDARLLELFAARLMFAHQVATLYKRINDQIQPRQTMGVIATRMQEPHRTLDSLLRLVLTGITCGQGLRFSRAMLLLVDEEGAFLKGRMAIGAMDRTEADVTWNDLRSRLEKLPSSDLDEVLRWIIGQADELTAGIESGDRVDCRLSQTIQTIEIPLKSGLSLFGAIAKCIEKSEPVHVAGNESDWLKSFLATAARADIGHYAFDCVPLLTSGRTLGVVVVDNRFRDGLEDRTMNREELRTLETFAELAAMSIDNRRRGRIEMYRAVAHQIRKPINQAHRLLEPGFQNLSASAGAMVASLVAKAARAGSSSSLFADMAEGRPLSIALERRSPDVLLHLFENLVMEFEATPQSVTFDLDRQSFVSVSGRGVKFDFEPMTHVMSNILENACVYAYQNTSVYIGACVAPEDELQIRVVNRGNLLGPDVAENAVKMNWRDSTARKVNPAGAGLGLWVAYEFIKAHYGHFTLQSHDGSVTASVFLPMYD